MTRSWLSTAFAKYLKSPRRFKPRPASGLFSWRPLVEALEDRTLPSSFGPRITPAGLHRVATLTAAATQTIPGAPRLESSLSPDADLSLSPSVAASFMVSAPSTTPAGSPFQITVTALDGSGNVATGYTGTVHFTTGDMNAAVVLPPDSTLSAGTGMFSVTLATAGTETVTATDTVTSSITGSTSISVSPAAAASFTLSAPATATAGTPFPITVTAFDGFGNVATGYTGTVHFATSDTNAATALPPDSTLTNGTGTFAVKLATAGLQTITATDTVNSQVTGSASVSVSPAAAASLAVSAPVTVTAGSAFSITVTAFDDFGNVARTYTGTVHFTTNDTSASVVLPPDSTLTDGTGMFSVTLATAGTESITATDTVDATIAGSASVTVSPAAAVSFSVAIRTTAVAGTPLPVIVTALDAFGNTATGYSGTVHFTSTDPQAALPPDSTLTNGAGLFSVTLFTATKPGHKQEVIATDTVNPAITGIGAVSIQAAAVASLTVAAPATATRHEPFSITVTAVDMYGNTATYTGTVHFTSSDSLASLPADSTLTSGKGTFSVTLATTGPQTITATDTALTSLTGSASVSVAPAPAAFFTVSAPGQPTAGTSFTITVMAFDMFGEPATSYSGTVHFTTSDKSAAVMLPPDSTLTNGTGTFNVTLATAGTQTITATDTVASSITGSGSLSVSPAAAVSLTVSIPATATAGSPFSITVKAFDRFGNVATGYAGTVHFATSDKNKSVALPADSTLTGGTGMFNVTLATAGVQTITATDTADGSITASGSVSVSAAAAASLVLSAPTAATAGVQFSVGVTALDGFGNITTGYTGTVHFSTSDTSKAVVLPPDSRLTNGTGTFTVTLATAGARTITVADTVDASLANNAIVSVSPAAAARFALSLPPSVTQGTPFIFSLTAFDGFGNAVPDYTGTVQFTSSDPLAHLPSDFAFTSADGGTMTFTATLNTWNFQDITATDTVNSSVTGSAMTPVIPTKAIAIVVTSTGDDDDGGTFTDPAGPDGAIDLREAIQLSNLDTFGTNTIMFDLGAGTQTIALASGQPLPQITNPVVIDAAPPAQFPTQQVVLDGPGNGLDVAGGGSSILGNDHFAIDGFTESGIMLEGKGEDVVEGVFIGTNSGGATGEGNSVGITINGTAGNTIGATAAGNVISGNSAEGIVITGTGATGNVIEDNLFGTNVQGTQALPNGSDGILIEAGASDNRVAGGTNVISGNGGDGVRITGAGTDGNIVLGNAIGTDVTGEKALGNSLAGVSIDSGASDNTIGATSGGIINLISGNAGDGVVIGLSTSDTNTSGNIVDDNAIGVEISGSLALGNSGNGVHIQGGASRNTVGGASGPINLISGNIGWGVVIDGDGAGTGPGKNQVDSNAVGTAVSGEAALANGAGGVEFINGAANDTLGGTGGGAINLIAGNIGVAQVLLDDTSDIVIAANAIGTDVSGKSAFDTASGDGIRIRDGATGTELGIGGFNLISGNTGNGITITGNGSDNTTIQDCAIGTDVTGESVLANANGVVVENGATGTQVGVPGSTDLISGNMGDGVLIEASGNTVQGNVIGANVGGSAPLPNGDSGVEIMGANNVVGDAYISGSLSGSGNIIAYNAVNGVLIDSGTGNGIHENSIFNNGVLGIGLAPGANGSITAPVLTSVTVSASGSTIMGTLSGTPDTTFLLEFYLSTSASPAQGQTQTFFSVTETTNARGNVAFTATTGLMFPSGLFVTATATDPTGDTSEFSNGAAS